jgi:hypothetical protein
VDFMIQDNLQIIDLTNCHRDENLPSGVTVYLVLANSDQIPQTFCFIMEQEFSKSTNMWPLFVRMTFTIQ